MNKPPDLPPEFNESAPKYDTRLAHDLSRIGSIDGKPYFRFVWGQDAAASRLWRGQRYLSYRHHLETESRLGEPEYGLDGAFLGYKRLYKHGDVLPAGIILVDVKLETDIGLPRFLIEMLEYYEKADWDNGRYTNEYGQIEFDSDGQLVDFIGDYPEGGLDYSMVWLVAEHKGCCAYVSPASNVGFQDDGVKCYGFRRLPTMLDIHEMQSRWNKFSQQRKSGADLRELQVSDYAVGRSAAARLATIRSHWDKVQAEIEDDMYQSITPFSKRLTSEGHGLDLFKYTDMGGAVRKHEAEHGPLIVEK